MTDQPDDGPITFDLDAAKARMDGQDSLVRAMLGFFVQELPPLMAEVDQAAEAGDAAAAVRPAHTIKTHCLNFGVEPCAGNAKQIELSGKEGDAAAIREAWPSVRRQLAEAVRVVETEMLA